jgi:hypothetical protein
MWHRWWSPHKRFSMSDNDPTEGLALYGKNIWENCQNSKELAEKLPYAVKSGKIFFLTGCNVAP